MDMVIHSYGYGETLVNSLNALAMIRNSNLYEAMIKVVTLGVGSMYAYMIAASNSDMQMKMYLRKVLGMAFLIGALLYPKTSMNVKDHVEKQFWKVDNIPLAFALPVGLVEQIGHLFTIGFEQAFNVVGGRSSFDYYNYGTIFGARLTKDLMRAKVTNPEFVYSLNSFIDRCVINRAKIGIPFTLSELFASEDIWGLVSANPGIVTRFDLKARGKHTLPNCKQGVAYFEHAMTDEGLEIISLLASKYRSGGNSDRYRFVKDSNRSNKTTSAAMLNEQVKALYAGSGMSVDRLLKHNFMMNAITEYRAGYMPNVKAQMQYEASGLLSADFAEWLLTKSLVVFKNIVYGAFIFLVPLILMSGGMTKYRNWMTVAFSLQLWPALFAMINMMIDYSYDPVKVISYSAWSTEIKTLDGMASVAGMLSALIPFLAIWITRMGEGGLMHMAGTIMSSANSAISSSAIEKSTGNVSYDNVSIGNRSHNNVSGNKYDDNMQYATGRNSIQQDDGSMSITNPNGQQISMRGAGYDASVGESRYLESEGRLSALQTSLRREENEMSSTAASYSNAQDQMIQEEASIMHSISQAMKKDKNFSIDQSTDEGREIMQAINTVDKMSGTDEQAWRQNAKTELTANAGLADKLSKYLGLSISGSVSAEQGASQLQVSSQELGNEGHINEKGSISDRTSKSSSVLDSLGIDENSQKALRATYGETKRLEETMSAHQDRIDAYNQNIDYTKTHGNEFSRDMTQDVIEAYHAKYGGDFNDASKAVSSGSKEALGIFRTLSAQRFSGTIDQISKGREVINDSSKIGDFTKQSEGNISKDPGAYIQESGRGGNLPTYDEAKSMITKDRTTLENEHASSLKDINMDYKQGFETAKDLEGRLNQSFAKNSADDFRKTGIGKYLGVGKKDEVVFAPLKMRHVGTGKLVRSIEDDVYENGNNTNN